MESVMIQRLKLSVKSSRALWIIVCLCLEATLVVGGGNSHLSLRHQPAKPMTINRRARHASDIPCSHRNQCGNFSDLPFYARNCFCDASCEVYEDCCRNYTDTLEHKGAGASTIVPHLLREIASCRRVEDIDTTYEMYIVDACPKAYKDVSVRNKCQNELAPEVFHRIPVFGRNSGVLYRNVYCAICAGEGEFLFWELTYKCQGPEYLDDNGTVRMTGTAEEFRRLATSFDCSLELQPPHRMKPRKCKSHVDRCARKWRDDRIAKKCKSHTAYVYLGLQVFKNKHCAICNHIDEAAVSCEDTRTPWLDFDVNSNIDDDQTSNQYLYITYDTNTQSIVIRSGRTQSDIRGIDRVVAVDQGQCAEGSVYDIMADECRRISCTNGSCNEIHTTTARPTTRRHTQKLKTTTTKTDAKSRNHKATTTEMIREVRIKIYHEPTTVSTTRKTTQTTTTVEGSKESTTRKSVKHKTDKGRKSTMTLLPETSTSKTSTKASTKHTTASTSASRRTTTSAGLSFGTIPGYFRASTTDPTTVQITTQSSRAPSTTVTNIATVLPSYSTITGPTSATTSSSPTLPTFSNNGAAREGVIPKPSATVPTTNANSSGSLKLVADDYDEFVMRMRELEMARNSENPRTVEATTTIKVKPSMPPPPPATSPASSLSSPWNKDGSASSNSAATFIVSMVTSRTHGTAEAIDSELTRNGSHNPPRNCSDILVMFRFNRLQNLATFIGTLISMVSLLVSFFIILVLPSVKTIRGKVLLSLILCMFVAHLLYLFALPSNDPQHYRSACYWIGAVLHYCVLGIFFWINAFAFDTCLMIIGDRLDRDRRRHCASFIGYSVYAWLTPAVVVGGSLLVDWYEADHLLVRPCYGNGVCFLTGRYALLLTLALPCGILTLVSMLLFFLTVSHLCSQALKKDTAPADGETPLHRRRLAICFCLALIVLLTWVTCFVATLYESQAEVVWWVFVVLSSTQGIFICSAFVCTRKVYGQLRNKGRSARGLSPTHWSYHKDNPMARDDLTSTNRLVCGSDTEIVSHETSI